MEALILVFAALFGASVGSFLNVCIFRLPRQCLRLWKPKLSFCPGCHRTLSWWENVPVFAYVLLRGRCRGCKAEIPFRYFLVEIGTAFLFVYLAIVDLLPAERKAGLFAVHAVLGAALIVCGVVDWDHRIIPDEIDIPGFLLAPIVAFFVPEVFGTPEETRILPIGKLASNAAVLLESALPWWGLPDGATHALTAPLHGIREHLRGPWAVPVDAAFTALVGAAAGAGLIWAIGWAGERIFKKEAMGFGDVKLMAMIGGFTGWEGVAWTMVAASMLGSVWGITHKVSSGRSSVTGKDVLYASPLAYLALRIFGAPPRGGGYRKTRALLKTEKVPLRLGGGLAARFATGDSYLAFGPFLAIGGAFYLYWPDLAFKAWSGFGELVLRFR